MTATHLASYGVTLQYWRKSRRMSQLTLALEADVSPRHISFLETGRSNPSREMVLLLAGVLDVPLRERNTLLLAAGFAPMYRETNLERPELAPVQEAIHAMLRQQEPYPAIVMNRHWDVMTANGAASRFFGFLLEGATIEEPMNVVRLMFDPGGLRPYVTNWEATAEALIRRIHREAVGGVPDEATTELLDEVLAAPDVPEQWRRPSLEAPLLPIIPVSFARDGKAFNYFSTVTTLGTPQDITLQEVRLECFFPLDTLTKDHAEALAARP